MMTRLLAILLLAIVAAPTQGQDATLHTTIDVIQAMPEGQPGLWRIGDHSYQSVAQTQIDDADKTQVGDLAQVRFVEHESGRILAALKPLGIKHAKLVDGPHAIWLDDGRVEILAFCDGSVQRIRRDQPKEPGLSTPAHDDDPSIHLSTIPPKPQPAMWNPPSRLLVISDIEGNHDALRSFLQANKVVDQHGNWAWGDGHLLFNGDIVDRGDAVTETLLLIRRLQRQAKDAGGQVHYVLGNHEAMIMAGDLRYVHPVYLYLCDQYGLTYDELYGPDSEMGRWLRSQNSVVQIGPLLFVHGGYAPSLDGLKLTPDEINEMIRSRLGPPAWPDREDLATSLAWNMQGPLWYRGYHAKYADEFGGLATDAQVQAVLDRHGASHIVVGHTLVDDVGWLDPDQQLIGVDVDWATSGEAEGLLLEDGKLHRLKLDGTRAPLGPARQDAQGPSEASLQITFRCEGRKPLHKQFM